MVADKYKINRIVGYIKLFDYPFDTMETSENIKDVLNYYRINEAVSEEELKDIKKELEIMAERAQTLEISQCIPRTWRWLE